MPHSPAPEAQAPPRQGPAPPPPSHLRGGRPRPRGQPGWGRALGRNEGKLSRRNRAPGRVRACAPERAPVMGRRGAAGWAEARAPARRRPGPRTPRRRTAASAPTAAAPKDPVQARPPGAPEGTRRPPPPQLGHPPGPPCPGPARGPWLPAEPPCAPFPSGDLRARERPGGAGRKRWRRDPETEIHEERGDRVHGAEIQRKRGQAGEGEIGGKARTQREETESQERERDPEREGTDGGGRDRERGTETERETATQRGGQGPKEG